MKIKNLYYSSHFTRSCRRLSEMQRKNFKKKLKIFYNDPFDPRLKTHKLSGKLKNYWSFSITYKLRVMFEFIDKESVGLVDIGTHDIYK